MLVAKRDPFHPESNEALPGAVFAPHAGGATPRFSRAISALQIVGTLLAIPVGIGSGYSMYRANFSVEATCQSLRSNIVGVLDRRVDAGARHMLVRRDVEAFERQCGGVDPDATAAFKTLLAADKPAAPVITTNVRHAEKPAEIVARKAEPHADPAVRLPAATATTVQTGNEPVHHAAAAASDAVWLGAVRRALLTHAAEPAPPAEAVAASVHDLTPPAVRPLARDAHTFGELPALPAIIVPPPTSVATAPPPPPSVDADHPVPPESIPPMTLLPKPAGTRSRLGDLVAQIPLLGPMIEPGRN